MNKQITFTDDLAHYLRSISLREHTVLTELREVTAKIVQRQWQILPEEGQFMQLLVKLMSAKKALEIGVFTGYSALSVALALPADGKLIACEVSNQFTPIAQQFWQKAHVAHKIELHLAPALETLAQLILQKEQESFDFIFIDADKKNYIHYYEQSLKLLRTGGLMILDNTLWKGLVADPKNHEPETEAIRDLNIKLLQDPRITLSVLPWGDGITLVYKN
jgi:caffeoyl-CoA O-methyltransferase